MNLLKKKNSSSSLFQKQKNTPEFLVKQTKQKQSILHTLSRAIKEVQFQFASQEPDQKEPGVIGDGRSSQLMCTAFEEVLKHGLKGGWFGQGTPSFWPVVLKISRKEATEFIGRLQHAQSDSAKCRGWIRLAVNECSLASYITVVCQDKSILSYYYESYSFVRDPEMTSTLTELLAGVTHIAFDLTVDVASLEFDSVPEAHSDLPIRMKDPYQNRGVLDTPPSLFQKVSSKEKHRKGKSKTSSGHRSPRNPGSLSATPSDSTQSLDDLISTASSEDDSRIRREESRSGHMGGASNIGGELAGDGEVEYHLPSAGSSSLDLESENSEPDIDWDYWKREAELQSDVVTARGNEGDEMLADEVDVEHTLQMKAVTRTESLTNLAEEIIDQDGTSEEGVGFEGEGCGPDGIARVRQSPLGISNHGDSEGEGGVLDRQETVVAVDESIKDRQDTLVEEEVGFGSILGNLVDSEYKPRQGNAATDIGISSPDHRSSLSTLTGSIALSSANPFDTSVPVATEAAAPSYHGNNPFLSQSPPRDFNSPQTRVDSEPPTAQFNSSTGIHGNTDEVTPTNPFQSAATTMVSGSEAPPTVPVAISTNPFEIDISNVYRTASRSPSPPAPPTSHLAPYSPANSRQPSGNLSPALLHPDLSPPLSHLNVFSPEERPRISPPLPGTPESCDLPDLSPRMAYPSQSNSPREPVSKRPGSSSSSGSSAPSKSVATDELESYSSSSIDISFADYAQLQLEQRIDQLRSPNENYFVPEVNMVDVQLALDRLKVDLIKGVDEDETMKDAMRKKIVELQMQLQELKDKQDEECELRDTSIRELYGHQLVEQRQRTSVYRVCEGCGKRIRGIIRTWFMCKLCGFTYHKKCLGSVDRICSSSSNRNHLDDSHTYILEVCPERGLTHQHFRCARCNVALNGTSTLTRLCDYCGLYFCPNCHRYDDAVVPARVIHNWDFTPRKVCCKCCDFLERCSRKPMLRVKPINPQLYTYVQALTQVEAVRRDLITMKKYFLECRIAKDTHLLQRLDEFPHFKDGSKRFSLMDLRAVHEDTLLHKLTLIHKEFANHIKKECQVCSRRGFICVLCKSKEVLYPFENRCRQCPKCQSLFHKDCYTEMTTCPTCSRVRTHRKPL